MNIFAEITGIKYTPFLCRELNTFQFDELDKALAKEATFILEANNKKRLAVSWWVSAKRTRSYPYARVYDSLSFAGKKITIIPIVKDEGLEGDRDFLQWDTISLMSLLGVYVIISYYKEAEQSQKYKNKITNQRFDTEQIKSEIKKLLSYQSGALHWNLEQISKVGELGKKALTAYDKISKKLNVKVHSATSAEKRIEKLLEGKETFMCLSRELAQKAQQRESITLQPKEKVEGHKATITIKNYLGGYYYFTCDEAKTEKSQVLIIEAKHTKGKNMPSLGDIKDGLLKMILFTNLKNVKIDNKEYKALPILKLTTENHFEFSGLSKSEQKMLKLLEKEAKTNNFKIKINNTVI